MGIAPALTAPNTSNGGTKSPEPCTVTSTSPLVIRRTLSAQRTGLGPIDGTFRPKTLCRSKVSAVAGAARPATTAMVDMRILFMFSSLRGAVPLRLSHTNLTRSTNSEVKSGTEYALAITQILDICECVCNT